MDNLYGFTREQAEALRGYMEGVRLAAMRAELAGPVPEGVIPPGSTPQQAAQYEKNRERAREDIRATIERETAGETPFAAGMRFALEG